MDTLDDKTIKNRFAAACEQFDKENAVSNVNLVCVLSMARDGVEKYASIPPLVLENIKRLLDHNRLIHEILFSGKVEIDFDAYYKSKEEDAEEFRKAFEILKQIK